MEHVPILTQLSQVVVYHSIDEGGVPDGTAMLAFILSFAEADLLVEANPDNDEAVLRVGQRVELQHWGPDDAQPRDRSADPRWSKLIGTDVPWRWQLTNQQGYRDGVQIEFIHGADSTQRQWITVASHLYEAEIVPRLS